MVWKCVYADDKRLAKIDLIIGQWETPTERMVVGHVGGYLRVSRLHLDQANGQSQWRNLLRRANCASEHGKTYRSVISLMVVLGGHGIGKKSLSQTTKNL